MRHKHAVEEHFHVWPRSEKRALHTCLTLCQDIVYTMYQYVGNIGHDRVSRMGQRTANSSFGITMSTVIFFIPTSLTQAIIDVRPYKMRHALGNRNLVGAHSVEQLVLFAQSEAINVDPRPVHTMEGCVEGILVCDAALVQNDV